MGILVTYAFMGQGSDDVALENDATVADLIAAIEKEGIEMDDACVISMGTVEVKPETVLYNGAVLFISEPVYEGL